MGFFKNSSARMVFAMALSGFFSGMILVGVYMVTLSPIRSNRTEALKEAVFQALPGVASFEAMVEENGQLKPCSLEEAQKREGDVVYSGVDAAGRRIGYAIPASGPGFMDNITVLYGFDPRRGVIVGMQVLESRETPGLGDKIIFDPAFHANFKALSVEPEIVPITRGETTAANQVDCISGATISSKAVVSLINESVRRWKPLLTETPQTAASLEPAH